MKDNYKLFLQEGNMPLQLLYKNFNFRNMKKLQLVEKVRELGLKNTNLQLLLETEVLKETSCEDKSALSERIRRFIRSVKAKLEKHFRSYSNLYKLEVKWLSEDLYYYITP